MLDEFPLVPLQDKEEVLPIEPPLGPLDKIMIDKPRISLRELEPDPSPSFRQMMQSKLPLNPFYSTDNDTLPF